jgi:hypothetical protein
MTLLVPTKSSHYLQYRLQELAAGTLVKMNSRGSGIFDSGVMHFAEVFGDQSGARKFYDSSSGYVIQSDVEC